MTHGAFVGTACLRKYVRDYVFTYTIRCAGSILSRVSSSCPLYLIPTTIESGPARCSTIVFRKPTLFIQRLQSAPE